MNIEEIKTFLEICRIRFDDKICPAIQKQSKQIGEYVITVERKHDNH